MTMEVKVDYFPLEFLRFSRSGIYHTDLSDFTPRERGERRERRKGRKREW